MIFTRGIILCCYVLEGHTAGAGITSFSSMLFCYNDEGGKLTPSQGHCICGVHVFSPCLHGFSLGTVVPPTSQRWECEVHWLIHIVWVSVGVCDASYTLGCQDRLQEKEGVGIKESYLFIFIFLKCMYNSSLFQCKIRCVLSLLRRVVMFCDQKYAVKA